MPKPLCHWASRQFIGIRSKPLYALRMEVPCWQTRKPFSSAGQSMPKAVFFSELKDGKRDRGAPRKRYKDQLKRQLAQAGISCLSWQQEASDRDSWRSSVRKTSYEFAAERHKAAKEKRRRQKERAASLSSSSPKNLRLS